MTISWPSLLRTARRLVRLTQEDFAADLGRSQSTVALWEAGRRPVPPAVRRRVLDILAGYYRRQPQYDALVAYSATLPHPATLYRPGMFIQSANPTIRHLWRQNRMDLVGTCILPFCRSDLRVFEMNETHIMPMLNERSVVLSVSYNDRSIMMPNLLVRRTATMYRVGEGKLLHCEDTIIGEAPSIGLPAADLRVLTADDVSDPSSG